MPVPVNFWPKPSQSSLIVMPGWWRAVSAETWASSLRRAETSIQSAKMLPVV
nr:hypothetical protein [Bosea vaviloviae]